MKSICSCLFIFSFFLAACGNNDKAVNIDPALRVKTALRSFSDTSKLDTFKVMLKGDRPKQMELLFTITPSSGIPVYTKHIKATELLDNYKEDLDLGKEKKQVHFLEEELGLFFEDENFIEPAVTATEEADKNTPDKNFFSELKRTGVNGFKYRLGKESKVYIAWSAAEGKVKPYYECCK